MNGLYVLLTHISHYGPLFSRLKSSHGRISIGWLFFFPSYCGVYMDQLLWLISICSGGRAAVLLCVGGSFLPSFVSLISVDLQSLALDWQRGSNIIAISGFFWSVQL